jgi:Na+-transporting methylmalonyl-CoA/oxaloacetate decarboxylase gamma subunit
MVKYIVLLVGIILAILGIWGLIGWWHEFVLVFMGGAPIFAIFVGVIMFIAAIGEIRDAIARKKEEEKEKEEAEKKEEAPSEEPKQEGSSES